MAPVSTSFTMEASRMRVLRQVAASPTMAAAAQALHLTPSAVSQQLATLARETGVPVVEKHGRGVRLTAQARVLLRHSAVIDVELEAARAELAAFEVGLVGTLAIGAFPSAINTLLAPAIVALRRDKPRLEIQVVESESPEVDALLAGWDIDMAISLEPSDPRSATVDVELVYLVDDPLLIALPADHRLAGSRALPMTALAEETWISSPADSPCFELQQAACLSAGFSPTVAHTCVSWDAMASLVAAHAGVVLVPQLEQAFRRPDIRVIGIRDANPTRRIYAAIRRGSQKRPALGAVIEALWAAAESHGRALVADQL